CVIGPGIFSTTCCRKGPTARLSPPRPGQGPCSRGSLSFRAVAGGGRDEPAQGFNGVPGEGVEDLLADLLVRPLAPRQFACIAAPAPGPPVLERDVRVFKAL